MRIAVIGAYGLIGSYVSTRLAAEGHAVVGVGRDIDAARRRFPDLEWKRADLAKSTVVDWAGVLADVEAVINCAGALQDSPRDDLKAVHVEGLRRLAEACEGIAVRRLVHISAAGVEPARTTAFNTTKLQAEALLAKSPLEWIILRPGLVFAPMAYGGTALLRGLAGFPGASPVAFGDSLIQTIGAEDLALAVVCCLEPDAPTRLSLDLVHDEALTLADLVRRLRRWLGLRPVPTICLPAVLVGAVAAASDAVAWLGWRSPMRTAAVEQLRMGVRGCARDAERLGLEPRSVDALLSSPSPGTTSVGPWGSEFPAACVQIPCYSTGRKLTITAKALLALRFVARPRLISDDPIRNFPCFSLIYQGIRSGSATPRDGARIRPPSDVNFAAPRGRGCQIGGKLSVGLRRLGQLASCRDSQPWVDGGGRSQWQTCLRHRAEVRGRFEPCPVAVVCR